MEIKYEYAEAEIPIKSATFNSSRGALVVAQKRSGSNNKELELHADCSVCTFNRPDLADLIALLQKFHDQMEG